MAPKFKLALAGISLVLAGLLPTILTVGGDGVAWFYRQLFTTLVQEFEVEPKFALVWYVPQLFIYWALLYSAGLILHRGLIVISRLNRGDD